ncbi:MAG: sugar-transfer associated ATP-grasp domain-containing protein [Eubacteriales bacterium]|nr:sugar-transfer associated ATP-grasp domain-containing protein [Eubacteriales bacterium]
MGSRMKKLQNTSLTNTPIVRSGVWLYKICTLIWMIFEERKMKPLLNPLTKAEITAIRKYWHKYVWHVPLASFQFYKEKTGRFDVHFIPKGLYHARIDPFFNHPILVYGTDNKNYYDLLMPEIKQPQTVFRKINGTLCDAEYNVLDSDQALDLCRQFGDLVGKEAIDTFDGFGITFWNILEGEEKLNLFFNQLAKDSIVQVRIKQHPALSAIHETSVNPIRVVTLMLDHQVHVLPMVIKIGVDQNQTDRFADGALVCGIEDDGRLMPVAYTEYGVPYQIHPQGFVFSQGVVPSLPRIREITQKLHARLGNYRMLAWDIAVDDIGDPVLIEVNMSGGGSVIIQLPHGPFFGDLTDRVLDEVFGVST